MTTNQIILLIIVILLGLILVFGTYFIITKIKIHKNAKKTDMIFNPTNLIEEESLLNVMEEKKNIQFKTDDEKFVKDEKEIKLVTSDSLSQEQKLNPFGVDLTLRNKESGMKIEIEDPNNKNKFIK